MVRVIQFRRRYFFKYSTYCALSSSSSSVLYDDHHHIIVMRPSGMVITLLGIVISQQSLGIKLRLVLQESHPVAERKFIIHMTEVPCEVQFINTIRNIHFPLNKCYYKSLNLLFPTIVMGSSYSIFTSP